METYEYTRRNKSSWQRYLLIAFLVVGGGYLVLYSDYKGDIRKIYEDIKPDYLQESHIIPLYELTIKTDTGYILGENEARVDVYGYKEVTYNISENESETKKEYGKIASKKIDINKHVVLENLISGNTYSIQIYPLYNSIEFYPQNYSILINNETSNTLIVKERADFRPLNMRLRDSLRFSAASDKWVLDRDKDYSFIFDIQTEGRGQVLCPEISFIANDSENTYITMWVKAGDLIRLPEGRVKFGKNYSISDMFTREMYSSVVLDMRNLEEGMIWMDIGDCKELTKKEVEFIIE